MMSGPRLETRKMCTRFRGFGGVINRFPRWLGGVKLQTGMIAASKRPCLPYCASGKLEAGRWVL